MARAQGARAQMALAFETTYGTPPASGYSKMPFANASLGAEQPLQTSELLGYGRDPQAPIKDAVGNSDDRSFYQAVELVFGMAFLPRFVSTTLKLDELGGWKHRLQRTSNTVRGSRIIVAMNCQNGACNCRHGFNQCPAPAHLIGFRPDRRVYSNIKVNDGSRRSIARMSICHITQFYKSANVCDVSIR